MSVDTDLATLLSAAMHGVSEGFYEREDVDGAYKSVKAELARLEARATEAVKERSAAVDAAHHWHSDAARLREARDSALRTISKLAENSTRIEAEAARLREERDAPTHRKQSVEYWRARSRVAEARCARLQQALDEADALIRRFNEACWNHDGDLPDEIEGAASATMAYLGDVIRLVDGEALAGPDTPAQEPSACRHCGLPGPTECWCGEHAPLREVGKNPTPGPDTPADSQPEWGPDHPSYDEMGQ